ncbi:hypothetical protein DLAC_01303 [Tieghemostelium lacteum]|uniref:Phospholipid/glycerol acyltransferase domain-containing protein n=1 Tax=Tieghemostelium lacteum TaxID=361077 RepID=A0A152A8A1_TIELA|nr:hypothetical protein DLAC_01303 [Tieghemostelium lacteum]|eukprot:KYR02462.1 hypothetical protein DLAC_01303 [Tieghemostelium lacteum]
MVENSTTNVASGSGTANGANSVRPKQKRYLHNFGRYSSTYTNPLALWAEKWYRRAISMTMITIVFVLLSLLFPALAIVALGFDMMMYSKRGGLNYVRVLSFFEVYLLIEIIAMVCSFIIWVVYMVSLVIDFDRDGSRFQRWAYWYQDWWGGTMLFGWSTKAMGLQVEVELEGENGFKAMFNHDIKKKLALALGINPKLVFLRHASFADTLVPQGIFSYFFHMRYIVKKELLWDPGLDISGSRTPNFFLFRDAGTEGMDVEMEAVKALVTDFKPKGNDVTCIWPEGTRFSKGKREKVLESFKKKNDTKSFDMASKLKHTLLPRVGGFLAMLDANPCGDVIFCSHYGLEASSNFAQMMKGELCNRIVKIKFTQVKYKDIPKTKAERVDWLNNQWLAIDKWVGDQEAEFLKEKSKKLKLN